MSRSPAAALARLKVVYGGQWQITKEPSGKLIAESRDDGDRLIAASTGELEMLLTQAQLRRSGLPG
jgi:hypothetical protein